MKKSILLAISIVLIGAVCMQAKDIQSLNESLFTAAKEGKVSSIQKLIKKGADVNFICDTFCKGWTPVMIAAAENHPDAVKLLLEKGANPNVQNQYGRTALHFAVNYSLEPIVNLLLEYKADPTIKTFNNMVQGRKEPSTPTQAAVRKLGQNSSNKEAYNILKTLVYKTGEVNAEWEDSTPLMFALNAQDDDFVKYLLNHNANPYHIIPETNPQGYVTAYYELDELVLAENNPASAEIKALFRSYNGKKKQEKALVTKKLVANFQKFQDAVDKFVAKNKKLPTSKTFFKDAKINIEGGKWIADDKIVTPDFTYSADCDQNRCSISLYRGDYPIRSIYRLSAVKAAYKPNAWLTNCIAQANLGTVGCMEFAQHIKELEVDFTRLQWR